MRFALALAAAFMGLVPAGLAIEITPALLSKIYSTPATCPESNTECRTAEQVAPYIEASFKEYKVTNLGLKAINLANLMFESGNFTHKTNKYPAPGRPGQGTANMQMPDNNLKYCKSIPALADEEACKIDSVVGASKETLNAMLALLTVDKYNFASGAWYMTTQCPDMLATVVSKPLDDVFTAFLESCIRAGTTDKTRYGYFDLVKAVFELDGAVPAPEDGPVTSPGTETGPERPKKSSGCEKAKGPQQQSRRRRRL